MSERIGNLHLPPQDLGNLQGESIRIYMAMLLIASFRCYIEVIPGGIHKIGHVIYEIKLSQHLRADKINLLINNYHLGQAIYLCQSNPLKNSFLICFSGRPRSLSKVSISLTIFPGPLM